MYCSDKNIPGMGECCPGYCLTNDTFSCVELDGVN